MQLTEDQIIKLMAVPDRLDVIEEKLDKILEEMPLLKVARNIVFSAVGTVLVTILSAGLALVIMNKGH